MKTLNRLRRLSPLWLALVLFLPSEQAVPGNWYVEGDFEPSERIEVTLTNTLDFDRHRVPVAIPRGHTPLANFDWQEISVVDPSMKGGEDPSIDTINRHGPTVTLSERNGRRIPYQLDDLDQDGLWDELFFMADLPASTTKTIYLYLGASLRGMFPHETHAFIGAADRHWVPWWESKNYGWYLWYGDSVDILAKRRPCLMAYDLSTRDESGQASPREDGNDVLWVGETFGAGGVGVVENTNDINSLARPRFSPFAGKGAIHDTRYSFHPVANGPIRSIIRVDTLNWRTDHGEYEMQKYFAAYSGKSYSTCRGAFTKFIHDDNDVEVAVGVRAIMNEYKVAHQSGSVITHGKDIEDIWLSSETLSEDQNQPIEWQALAIAVKEQYGPKYEAVEANGGNHLLRFPLPSDRGFEFLMVGGWSEGFENNQEETFTATVEQVVKEYNHPPLVEIGKIQRQ